MRRKRKKEEERYVTPGVARVGLKKSKSKNSFGGGSRVRLVEQAESGDDPAGEDPKGAGAGEGTL